jgi:hypothetical protein
MLPLGFEKPDADSLRAGYPKTFCRTSGRALVRSLTVARWFLLMRSRARPPLRSDPFGPWNYHVLITAELLKAVFRSEFGTMGSHVSKNAKRGAPGYRSCDVSERINVEARPVMPSAKRTDERPRLSLLGNVPSVPGFFHPALQTRDCSLLL